MVEQMPAGVFLGMNIYSYSIFLCLSIVAGLTVMLFCQKKRRLHKDTALRYGLWAIPLGIVFARLFYCFARWDYVFNERGWTFLFSLWEGGFALYGALLGCLLAALILAKLSRVKAGDLLDCIAPGAALTIAVARFAEAFTSQGVGGLVETEALQQFPFAVQNMYGDWVLPVFFYEGVAAILIGIIAYVILSRKGIRPGDTALMFLLLFGAAQVVLESLRQDDYLRWGFVKVSQMASMGLVLIVSVLFGRRAVSQKKKLPMVAAGFVLLALGVGACVLIEFALDKSTIPNTYLYSAMTAIMALMTGIALAFRKAGQSKSVGHSA